MVGQRAIGPAAMLFKDDTGRASAPFPCAKLTVVAVGHRNTGPRPQVMPSTDWAGEKKNSVQCRSVRNGCRNPPLEPAGKRLELLCGQ